MISMGMEPFIMQICSFYQVCAIHCARELAAGYERKEKECLTRARVYL